MVISFLIRLDQICLKWLKLDQIGFLPNQKMFSIINPGHISYFFANYNY